MPEETVIFPVSETTGQGILSVLEDMAEAITPVNPYIDLAVTIPANGWSATAPYTYTWMNANITTACEIAVYFTGKNPVSYIGAEKIGGGVQFTAPYKPTSDVPVMVRVIKAEAESVTNIDASMVSTEAVDGASNVEQGLASHSQAIETLDGKFSVYELTSGQQLKTVAVDTSICPANSVRWLNLRNGSTTGLPNNNALYGMARVNRRNANTIQITTLADNGESFETHSADGGSTWSEWYNAIESLNALFANFKMLVKVTTDSSETVTFTAIGRGSGFMFISQNGTISSVYSIWTTNNNGDLAYEKISGRDVTFSATNNVLSVSLGIWSNVNVLYAGLIS